MTGDEVRDVLALLVRTPSVNPSLAPAEDGAGEALVAEAIREWLVHRGVEAWLEEVEPARPNVVARVGDGSAPVLVLCGHTDTVSARDMTVPPFAAVVEEGRMYGRGAYDMKSGVAAAMCAMAELAKDPPRGTVLGAFVVDEEYASIGAHHFVARHRADACILTEPSEERLVLAHKGFVWVEVTVRGAAAHGSRWDLGRSAIADAARLIVTLDDYDRYVLRLRTHPLVGPASMHCSMVQGGDGWSTYAPSCTVRIERRTLPGETADSVVQEIRDLIHDCGIDADLSIVLRRAPLECPADAPLAREVRSAAAGVLGHAPEQCGVQFWMDAAVFDGAGIEAVDYGPTGAGAHAPVEWVDLASVTRCARVLESAARRFCS